MKHLVFDVPQARKISVEHDLTSSDEAEPLGLVELAAADAASGNRDFLVLLIDEKLLEHHPSANLNFDVIGRKLLADFLLQVVDETVDDVELLHRNFQECRGASDRVRETSVEAVNDSAELLGKFKVRLGDCADTNVKNILLKIALRLNEC